MRRRITKIVMTFVVLSTVVLFATSVIAAERVWVMGTSPSGSAGYVCTMGLSSLVKKYTPYNLEAMPTPGSTASVRMFGKKEVDFAYLSGWGLSEVYDKLGPFEKLSLPANPYHGIYYSSFELIAITKAERDDIKSYKDFAGKKIFPMLASTGWHDLFKLTLEKMGEYKKYNVRFLDLMQAADALKIGNLEVVIGYSTNLGELSVSWIKNIDSLLGIKIVSPSPREQKEISALKYPGVFYGEKMSYAALTQVNAASTKKANPNGVWLWGSYQGWHPGPAMPTEVMYQMYKAWLEHAKEIANVNAFLEYYARDPIGMQVKAIDTAPSIPVHPGVAKYLKEKGLWKSNWTVGKLDPGVE